MSKPSIPIFHLHRRDGTAVFLHPFRRGTAFRTLIQGAAITGLHGTIPRIESTELFDSEMRRLVALEMKRWGQDHRYTFRLVLSAGVFLVSWVFLAAVVRFPHIYDELLISSGAAITTYIWLRRRDLNSGDGLSRSIALRSAIEAISFEPDQFTMEVERQLKLLELRDNGGLMDEALNGVAEVNVADNTDRCEHLIEYLELTLASPRLQNAKSRIQAIVTEPKSSEALAIRRWIESDKMDGPLMALYAQLSRALLEARAAEKKDRVEDGKADANGSEDEDEEATNGDEADQSGDGDSHAEGKSQGTESDAVESRANDEADAVGQGGEPT